MSTTTDSTRARRGLRMLRNAALGLLGALAIAIAMSATNHAQSSDAAGVTYPPYFDIDWPTDASGNVIVPNKSAFSVTVEVTAVGGYTVKNGSVRVCEDSTCFGSVTRIDSDGVTTLRVTGVTPEAGGKRSLQVVFYPAANDGTELVLGAAKVDVRSGWSQQVEVTVR